MRFYLFETEWYNEYKEDCEISKGLVCAASYSEAIGKIERRLPGNTWIRLQEMDDNNFIFMNEENYQKFAKENIYALDPEKEEQSILGQTFLIFLLRAPSKKKNSRNLKFWV